MDWKRPGSISESPDLADVRVLILTTFELDEYVFEALRSGASGFLLKDTEPEDLLRAVRVVAAGEALLSPSVTRTLISEFVARPERRSVAPDSLVVADRPRARGARGGRHRAEQRRDRRGAHHLAGHGPHARQPHHDEARCADRGELVVVAYQSGLVAPGAVTAGDLPRELDRVRWARTLHELHGRRPPDEPETRPRRRPRSPRASTNATRRGSHVRVRCNHSSLGSKRWARSAKYQSSE